MERKKLVLLEILLIIGLIIIICLEIYLGWNLLKTNEYELEINNSNRKFISNYFENCDEIDTSNKSIEEVCQEALEAIGINKGTLGGDER